MKVYRTRKFLEPLTYSLSTIIIFEYLQPVCAFLWFACRVFLQLWKLKLKWTKSESFYGSYALLDIGKSIAGMCGYFTQCCHNHNWIVLRVLVQCAVFWYEHVPVSMALLGRLFWVDLIKWVSNVRPQSFFNFNEIWHGIVGFNVPLDTL